MTRKIKELLLDMVKYPSAVEAMLPEGVPKLSQNLADITGRLPDVPDLPVDVPLPPAPPTAPTGPASRTRRVPIGGSEVRIPPVGVPTRGEL